MFRLKLVVIALFAIVFSNNCLSANEPINQTQNDWNPKRTWVFMVGLLEWKNSKSFASFPQRNRRDAILLDVLRERGVPENQIIYLKDSQATTAKIQSNFESFLSKAQPGDWVFVYYCGHGYKNDSKGVLLASYDAGSNNGWAVKSVPETIDKFFKGSNAVIMLDNCYSGAMAEAVKNRRSRISYAVLASSHFNSFSTGNWTFTEALIYGFRGEPFIDDDKNGSITFSEIAENASQDMLFAEEQYAQFITTGAFGKQTVLANSSPSNSPQLGERIEAYDQGGWYKALITDVKNGKYKVHYFGYEYNEDRYVSANEIRKFTPKQYRAGTNVEAEWQGKWYPAKIVKNLGGAHLVSYDGFGSEWDEWIPSSRVRQLGQSRYQVGDEIQVEWKGTSYRARILKVNENQYFIHYIGYSKEWDEWITANRIK